MDSSPFAGSQEAKIRCFQSFLSEYCEDRLSRNIPIRGSSLFVFNNEEDGREELQKKVKQFCVTNGVFQPCESTEGEDPSGTVVQDVTPTRRSLTSRSTITYHVGDTTDERTEHILVKFSDGVALNQKFQRLFSSFKQDAREIDFYRKIMPELENWCYLRKYHLDFCIPTCFHGSYDEIPENDDKPDWISDKLTAFNKWRKRKRVVVPLSILENESEAAHDPHLTVLVTHDLESANFEVDKKTLLIGEVKAVLRELAQLHAASWAYQVYLETKIDRSSLLEKWPSLSKKKELVKNAKELVSESIDQIIMLINKKLGTGELRIVEWLNNLKTKLKKVLKVLFKLPKHPLPSCLVHLDLHHKNIALRHRNQIPPPDDYFDQPDKPRPRFPKSKLTFLAIPPHKQTQPNAVGRHPYTIEELLAMAPTDEEYKLQNVCTSMPPYVQESSNLRQPVCFEQDVNHRIECRIMNWKFVGVGSPLHDVAFLILTSLPKHTRDGLTPKLIEFYYKVFEDTALKLNYRLTFSLEALQAAYKKYFFSGFLFLMCDFLDQSTLDEIKAGNYTSLNNFLEILVEVMNEPVWY